MVSYWWVMAIMIIGITIGMVLGAVIQRECDEHDVL